jgi:hypothetical protein
MCSKHGNWVAIVIGVLIAIMVASQQGGAP